MSIQNLKFESASKLYVINTNSKPTTIKIDDFVITETFSPNSDYDLIAKNLGDYKIIIEKPIKSQKDLQNSRYEVSNLIGDLDRAWMYSCGHPLSKKDIAFMAPIISQANGVISGWNSNYEEVQRDLNKGRAHARITIQNMHHSVLPYWPLKNSGEIRKKYIESVDYIKALVDLHYFAHKVGNGHAMLFFLAKALEIVRSILTGKNDDKKEEQLPLKVRDKLHSSFHKILGLANTRYEIRHIVKDPKNSSLHQKLSHEEIDIFKSDSDLIIRAVVSMELDIPLCIPERN